MASTAERLAEAMDQRELDQSALARELGVTQGAISKILLGKTSNSRLLPRIAVHLGVSLPWLLGEEEDDGGTHRDRMPADARELIDRFAQLPPADKKALLQIARSMSQQPAAASTVQEEPAKFIRNGSKP